MHAQLEFDLVSPLLGEPTAAQMKKVQTILQLPAPATPAQAEELRGITARLNYLELVYDERSVSIENELRDVRVLVGEADWQRDKKIWTRRARRDPLRLRKIILSMKKFWRL